MIQRPRTTILYKYIVGFVILIILLLWLILLLKSQDKINEDNCNILTENPSYWDGDYVKFNMDFINHPPLPDCIIYTKGGECSEEDEEQHEEEPSDDGWIADYFDYNGIPESPKVMLPKLVSVTSPVFTNLPTPSMFYFPYSIDKSGITNTIKVCNVPEPDGTALLILGLCIAVLFISKQP